MLFRATLHGDPWASQVFQPFLWPIFRSKPRTTNGIRQTWTWPAMSFSCVWSISPFIYGIHNWCIYICMGLYGLYMGLYGIIWVIYGIINHLLSGDAHPRSSKWIKIGGPRNVTCLDFFDVDPKWPNGIMINGPPWTNQPKWIYTACDYAIYLFQWDQ